MTKSEITTAVIKVFENGAPNLFVNGIDYHTYDSIAVTLAYPLGLTSINDTTIGRKEHPFVHVTGGFEEKPRGHAAVSFPVGCRVFYFNPELCSVMNSGSNYTFFRGKKIKTIPHTVIKKGIPIIGVTHEHPDLIKVNGKSSLLPCHNGNLVVAANQSGHNFICQSDHGLFNKICEELSQLSDSNIDPCYYVALYSHKQNLGNLEICSYRNANKRADQLYQHTLNTYRNDISQIDPKFIHLLFRGVRPIGESTYFHVFIVQKPANLTFVQVNTPKGDRIRPVGYVNNGN